MLLKASQFGGEAGRVMLLAPDLAVLGLGPQPAACGTIPPYVYGALATALPPGSVWRFAPDTAGLPHAILGFCLGAYRPGLYKTQPSAADRAAKIVRLEVPDEHQAVLDKARVHWLVRDLINLPPNALSPEILAEFAARSTAGAGMQTEIVRGADLETRFPTVAFAGAGSVRAPQVFVGHWQGSGATDTSKLISLCGKGVVFDTGGYDLKPPAGMLRMKKDMGGAAITLGLAMLIMQADWPVRLELRLGCIENAVSGNAMRPSDVVRTRAGISVEIGNTDAEGRLVLCDLLHEAALQRPSQLLDVATLTGAARVALGPEISALFTNADHCAEAFQTAVKATGETVWRMPLHNSYASWLDSDIADINNVSEKSHAGAIIAALFLRRFVPDDVAWAHLDVFAWNESARPGRPPGGEAESLHCMLEALRILME